MPFADEQGQRPPIGLSVVCSSRGFADVGSVEHRTIRVNTFRQVIAAGYEDVYGLISIVVPSGTARQSSSISQSVTAMQPAVQSHQR